MFETGRMKTFAGDNFASFSHVTANLGNIRAVGHGLPLTDFASLLAPDRKLLAAHRFDGKTT